MFKIFYHFKPINAILNPQNLAFFSFATFDVFNYVNYI